MAFTITRQQFKSRYTAFENSSEIHIAHVFHHEPHGDFVNCLEALLRTSIEKSSDPLLIDRTQLASSDLDTTELLEALLVLERNRNRLENTVLVIVYNTTPHPAHLHNVFSTAAELKSIHYLKLVGTLEEAQAILGF